MVPLEKKLYSQSKSMKADMCGVVGRESPIGLSDCQQTTNGLEKSLQHVALEKNSPKFLWDTTVLELPHAIHQYRDLHQQL